MKDIAGIIVLTLLSLFVGFFFGEKISTKNEENIINCGYNKDDIIETYNGWINEALIKADKRAEKYPVKVVAVKGIMEYNTTPELMNVKLYEDFKNSKVCRAFLLVNYTPNDEKQTNEEIEVRFQRVATSPDEDGVISTYMNSTGHDVQEMTEQALEFFKKHNMDKKQ